MDSYFTLQSELGLCTSFRPWTAGAGGHYVRACSAEETEIVVPLPARGLWEFGLDLLVRTWSACAPVAVC